LLSRLDKAGLTISSAKPILKVLDDKDVIGLLEASSDKYLPLVAKAIELSPSLIPLAAVALKTPPTTLYGGAIASVAAAGALIAVLPDDSVLSIAAQVAIAIPLGVILPISLGGGGFILSKSN
jgi:hypothetical protein